MYPDGMFTCLYLLNYQCWLFRRSIRRNQCVEIHALAFRCKQRSAVLPHLLTGSRVKIVVIVTYNGR